MAKILLTGANGFIGKNLAEHLASSGDVHTPDRSELDLMDDGYVREYLHFHRFDVVIHSATVRSNRKIKAPADLFQRNCRMFLNLARNSASFGKLLYFGSGAVYDSRHFRPLMPESYFDAHVPADDYGFSKYVCAKAADAVPNAFELRLFAVFGPYESWEVRFLSNACCRALWDLPIVIRQNVRFDFLDVADLAGIVEWFMAHTPRHRHYNVCSGRPVDLVTLARKVLTVCGKKLGVVIRNEGPGIEYSGDNRLLLSEIGPFHFRDIDASLRGLYRWYEEHKQSVDPHLLHFDAK